MELSNYWGIEDIFAYTCELDNEKLLIVSNFTEKQVAFSMPEDVKLYRTKKLLINNYEANDELEDITLQAYETRVFYFSN